MLKVTVWWTEPHHPAILSSPKWTLSSHRLHLEILSMKITNRTDKGQPVISLQQVHKTHVDWNSPQPDSPSSPYKLHIWVYQVQLWITLCSNIGFVMANPWLAQKSSSKAPLRSFRWDRAFLPITQVSPTLSPSRTIESPDGVFPGPYSETPRRPSFPALGEM